jgi:hypothetical protein
MPISRLPLILIICMISFNACRPHRAVNVIDDFESSTLSDNWSTEKFVPGALQIQSTVFRSGKSAIKITLRHGDQIDKEKGTILERAELLESEHLWAIEDSAYAYSFSLFLPSDFPIVPTRLVIAQWKQDCASGACDPASPVIAIRYQSGELSINVQPDTLKQVLFRTKEDIRNRWLDFRFHIRFSRLQSGCIKAWINDRKITDYAGPTAYPERYGYPMPGRFYFKTGLYRDKMIEPMVIYIDDYMKQLLARNDL